MHAAEVRLVSRGLVAEAADAVIESLAALQQEASHLPLSPIAQARTP